ncbi:MAG TPA: hypothetical protein VKN16_23365 [Methylomirabilota bacterium]|jgi:hypothetical protein|nr:hypothetical protein [Methylomirabilota bacterium]
MDQLVSFVGAFLVLGAYGGQQLRRVDSAGWLYSALNLAGAGLLTLAAWQLGQWGFVLLEGVWTLVSAGALVRALRAG